jgi:hypothetical protein
VNQNQFIDEDLKAEKFNRIANGFIEIPFSIEDGKRKYIDGLKNEMGSEADDLIADIEKGGFANS